MRDLVRVSRPISWVNTALPFLAGAFEPSSDVSPVPELVIAPDWGRLKFTVEGEPFGVETTPSLAGTVFLDVNQDGVLGPSERGARSAARAEKSARDALSMARWAALGKALVFPGFTKAGGLA